MLPVAVFAWVASQHQDVAEFFPLKTGTTWTYQDEAGATAQTFIDSVGNEQKIGDETATPIVTKFNGQIDGSTFYRIDGDTVFVVAFDQNKPLAAPYPIVKYGSGKNTWDFKGVTQWLGADAPLSVKGSCKKVGDKELFGSKHQVIEVVLDAVIGPSGASGIKSHQVSHYASGIGLVDLKDTTTINKTKSQRTRTLVSFKAGETQ